MLQEIANHLWQSSLFLCGIALLCLFLKNEAARIRYWLWWIASLKFLLPFSILTALGNWLSASSSIALTTDWSDTLLTMSQPFATDQQIWGISSLLISVWTIGACAAFCYWSVRAARLRKLLRQVDREPEPLLDQGRPIQVYRTEACVEPGIFGLLHPVLLLPKNIEDHLSPSQFESVLAHELCHIRRRDNLTAALHMLVEAVFWFHPMVWWLGHRLIDEREQACDEMVVELGHDRQAYAESILNVCDRYVATRLACAPGISGSDLKRRVIQIMNYQGAKNMNNTKKMIMSLALIAAFVLPVLGGVLVNTSVQAQESSATEINTEGELPLTNTYEIPAPVPVSSIQPNYPPRAAERGLEGYCVIGFTITTTGTTEDHVELECTNSIFLRESIRAAELLEYSPIIVDGRAIEVNHYYKFTFEMPDVNV